MSTAALAVSAITAPPAGLSSAEAERRLTEHGPNVLTGRGFGGYWAGVYERFTWHRPSGRGRPVVAKGGTS